MTDVQTIERIWRAHRRQYQQEAAARWITSLVVWGFVIGCAYQFVKELSTW
jgi:hypothetical protein